jgi:hypothetical protein
VGDGTFPLTTGGSALSAPLDLEGSPSPRRLEPLELGVHVLGLGDDLVLVDLYVVSFSKRAGGAPSTARIPPSLAPGPGARTVP